MIRLPVHQSGPKKRHLAIFWKAFPQLAAYCNYYGTKVCLHADFAGARVCLKGFEIGPIGEDVIGNEKLD